MRKHLTIRVRGRVQGVWYRASTEQKARELDLKGFVKNDHDGSVYIEAEGEENALDQLVAWCKKGPLLARVDQIEVEDGAMKDYGDFEQRR